MKIKCILVALASLLLVTSCSPCKEGEFSVGEDNNVCLVTDDHEYAEFVEFTLSFYNTDFGGVTLNMYHRIKDVNKLYLDNGGRDDLPGDVSGVTYTPCQGPCKRPSNEIHSTAQSLTHELIHLKIFIDTDGAMSGTDHTPETGFSPELAAREVAIEEMQAEFYPDQFFRK